MKTIHKFDVPPTYGMHMVKIPGFIRWLTVQLQNGVITLWAEVDTDDERVVDTPVVIAWTGQPIRHSAGYTYIGTVQAPPLVHHVYGITYDG